MQNQKFKNGNPTSPISGGKSDFPNIHRNDIWISDFQVDVRKSDILNRFRKSFLGLKKSLIVIVMLSIILPIFSLAQGETSAPQTVEGAKEIGIKISEKLPDAVKSVWWNEALPILKKIMEISLKIWNKTLGPVVEPWLRKELEKRRPALELEFRKERKEMENELWDRFKDLLK